MNPVFGVKRMVMFIRTGKHSFMFNIRPKDPWIIFDVDINPDLEALLQVMKAQKESGCQAMALNLSSIPFIESRTLGSLVQLHQYCSEHYIRFAVVALSPFLQKLFTMTHLDRIIQIYETEQQLPENLPTQNAEL
jgi:anti-anti-sigma factor